MRPYSVAGAGSVGVSRLQAFREKAGSSFWFLPSVLAIASVPLAIALLSVDENYLPVLGGAIPGLFGGAAEAARQLLATIAGSLITVISIAFSITIVAMQQASTQYSPRVLRTFTKDRGNQLVLGTYLATFVYALLVLQSVRTPVAGTPGFVPAISITVALLLALACIGLLVYFISHISLELQVETIISSIHRDLTAEIETLFPEHVGRVAEEELSAQGAFAELSGKGTVHTITAPNPGFVRAINEDALERFSPEGVAAVFVMPRIGDFVIEGSVIMQAVAKGDVEGDVDDVLRAAIVVDSQRSVKQDPLFAIKQLVDIALRALSPGINDPTTAESCLLYLGDALSKLAGRKFPEVTRTFEENPAVFVFNRPTWRDFVNEAFSQIRRSARDHVHVTRTLVHVLESIAAFVPPGNRFEPVLEQLEEIRRGLDTLPASAEESTVLLERIRTAEHALRRAA